MSQSDKFDPTARTYAAQQAYLAIEQQPYDKAEQQLLEQVRRYVQTHSHQNDLRDLAGAIRELMGDAYQVGCGSCHIWIKRSPERLAVVADRLTTAYRDWFEPRVPGGPRRSIRTEQGLPVAGVLITTSTPTR
ncbi:hypothetical protein FY528_04910 [Hymenobacter lutimineralis]|uniref:Uncharacterized protein n=1 Tax=Hymenobacter lutimineralis TaxID=2606448 RepID=A0A5D6VBG0_9BACT|nr:hypothetical protein [Hymenobacter lutimineralis]TYZ12637.1 hypothetical protein FY528_04910 [Hymenobacter lutimineralis]